MTLKERYGRLRTQIREFFEFYRRVKEAENESRANRAQLIFVEQERNQLLQILAAQKGNPLARAKDLLAQADMIMAQPAMNSYELRTWRAEYRNFRLEERRAKY